MFSFDKILHEIIYLLSLGNSRMNLLKLMKELYLIDRQSIADRGVSISGDIFYSMPHGPVLSGTLNMLYDLNNNNWGDYLEVVEAKYYPDIQLKQNINPEMLSAKDKEYIKNIFDEFNSYTPKELEEYTHKLPEWENPKGSSLKIHFRDIMKAVGYCESEIKEEEEEYRSFAVLQKLAGQSGL